MELTNNNYLRGSGSGETWRVEIDPPQRKVGTYYHETCRAAEMIWSQKQGPLYILYSGGMDSEYALSVFLSLGMRVVPVIMTFDPDYNSHDIQHATSFCEHRGLSYIKFSLNFDHFVKTHQLLDIATKHGIGSYKMIPPMWLANQLGDGTVITGNDPPLLRYTQENGNCLEELQYIHSQFGFWRKEGIHGTPFFLSYTPEMMLAFLKEPVIHEFGTTSSRIPDTNQIKRDVFNNNGGKFIINPRPKYTGYEKIWRMPISQHPDLIEIDSWKQYQGVSLFKYDDICNWLSKYQNVV